MGTIVYGENNQRPKEQSFEAMWLKILHGTGRELSVIIEVGRQVINGGVEVVQVNIAVDDDELSVDEMEVLIWWRMTAAQSVVNILTCPVSQCCVAVIAKSVERVVQMMLNALGQNASVDTCNRQSSITDRSEQVVGAKTERPS